MNESQISVRYAKALFKSALEKKILDSVNKDMDLLAETCKLDDFQYMIELPSLQPSQKSKFISSIFAKNMSDISLALIHLVIKNKRETYLPGIARNFGDLYRTEKGIRSAGLVTALEVDDSTIKSIRELIKKSFDADVELSASVDSELIGGFILKIEHQQYDSSVASNLKRMKKQLLQNSIENK
jgi:F-type H+-transporting ATPase subunit delta